MTPEVPPAMIEALDGGRDDDALSIFLSELVRLSADELAAVPSVTDVGEQSRPHLDHAARGHLADLTRSRSVSIRPDQRAGLVYRFVGSDTGSDITPMRPQHCNESFPMPAPPASPGRAMEPSFEHPISSPPPSAPVIFAAAETSCRYGYSPRPRASWAICFVAV